MSVFSPISGWTLCKVVQGCTSSEKNRQFEPRNLYNLAQGQGVFPQLTHEACFRSDNAKKTKRPFLALFDHTYSTPDVRQFVVLMPSTGYPLTRVFDTLI